MSRLLVIEGLIGVGKTSLCRVLEREWGADLVLEPAEDNPFLASFYADRERYAFPAQMFYLASRLAQQQRLAQPDLFTDLVVSDYLFEKDRLFARLTLSGQELALYERFADLMAPTLPRPDLVIFLDAPTEVILERIARRGIAAERRIDRAYLEAIRAAYMDLWRRWRQAPVRFLDSTDLDYVNDPDDRAAVLGMIRAWLDGQPTPGAPASVLAEREDQPELFGTGA